MMMLNTDKMFSVRACNECLSREQSVLGLITHPRFKGEVSALNLLVCTYAPLTPNAHTPYMFLSSNFALTQKLNGPGKTWGYMEHALHHIHFYLGLSLKFEFQSLMRLKLYQVDSGGYGPTLSIKVVSFVFDETNGCSCVKNNPIRQKWTHTLRPKLG